MDEWARAPMPRVLGILSVRDRNTGGRNLSRMWTAGGRNPRTIGARCRCGVSAMA